MENINRSLVKLKKESFQTRDTETEDTLKEQLQSMDVELNAKNI